MPKGDLFEKTLTEELGLTPGVEIPHGLEIVDNAFYSHFYKQKTQIQKQSAAHIFAGRNALLVSATASGKTEAAVAPIAARIISQKQKGLCLYISPTKALLEV